MSKRPVEITETLVRHEHAIGDLGRRMEGVETGIKGIDGKMDGVASAIAEMRGAKGPGWSETMKMTLTGGGIVAMTATAIWFLVEARSAPEMVRLKTDIAKLAESVTRRDHEDQAELVAFRRKREAELEEIKAKVGWAARVEVRR